MLAHKDKPLILAVTGPTAAGKTDLAIALSQHFPIELINMDSAQVYRDMNIGTAKISPEEQAAHPHHLMSILSPEEQYSAAQFVEDVHALAQEIHQRGRTPLLVGGTILYYKALIDGLAKLPPADEGLREELRNVIANDGQAALYEELVQIDPETAKNISSNDIQRLVRFVEIARLTGRPPSQIFSEQKAQASSAPFQFFHICFFPTDRVWLHQRIEKRFDIMLAQGLIDEVKYLRQTYQLTSEHASMRCAGYRQAWQYLQGDYDNLSANKNNKPTNSSLEEMRNRGVFATRQLAKRQLTWLRKIPADITINDPENYSVHEIVESLQSHFATK